MIPGPYLLIGLPLAVSPLIWLFRRWATVAAWMAAGLAAALGILVWCLPLNEPVSILGHQVLMGQSVSVLGRVLVMSPADRLDLFFVYGAVIGLFLFAWRVSQGWTFFPLGAVLLSVMGGALLSESHIFAVLLLQVGATLCVFLIQGGQTGSTRGALRFLTFITLAMPPLLVTSWLLGRYELTPEDTGLLDASSILFAIGFAILLGTVPFHIWISAVGADAPPLVATYVLGVFYAVAWFIMLDLVEAFDWLATHPDFGTAFRYSGYSMIIVGGVLASVEQRLGRLMGYAALVDMGAAQLALALQSQAGLVTALLMLSTRAISMTVMTMGISIIRHRAEGDDLHRLIGWGRRVPWATAALVVGGLSLAGLPPGAGFPVRWGALRLIARHQAGGAVLLLIASAGVTIGIARALMALLREPEPGYVGSEIVEEIETAHRREPPPEPEPEPRLAVVMIVVALVVCIGWGLAPQFHAGIVQRVAQSYSFLSGH